MALPKPVQQMVSLSTGPFSSAREWGCFLLLIPGSLFALIALQGPASLARLYVPLWLGLFLFICFGFTTRYRLDLRRREIQAQWSLLGLGWFRRLAGFEQLLEWRASRQEHPANFQLLWLDEDGQGRILEVGSFDSQQSLHSEAQQFLEATAISFLPLPERVERQLFWPLESSATGCTLGFLGCLSPCLATFVLAMIEVFIPTFRWPSLDWLVYASMIFFLFCPMLRSYREYDACSGEVVRFHQWGNWRLPFERRSKISDMEVSVEGKLSLVLGTYRFLLADFCGYSRACEARKMLLRKCGQDVH